MLEIILLVFFFVLECCAAASISAGRWQLGWLGLAFYAAALIFGHGLPRI